MLNRQHTPCRPWPMLGLSLGLGTGAALAQSPAAPAASPSVEIVGTAPLAGLGVDRDRLPYASVLLRRETLETAHGESLTDLLARRVSGMQTSEIQGSPLQADLTFRGQRASGLLGASQGLSVYLDGVRINEAFGDVVNWDLVPEFALQSLTVTPGANPAFGLNTLGGAVALTTRSGETAPGLSTELGWGSHSRRRASLGLGQQHGDGWHSWVGATAFGEQGWRDHSPGEQALLMAKLGRRAEAARGLSWELSALAGQSTLVGNGLVPLATLDEDGGQTPDLLAHSRSAVFSHPDRTRNRLGQLALNLSWQPDAASRAQALAYVRSTRRNTVNGDVADDSSDPDENAALNTTATRQTAWGLAASLARRQGEHQWQLGASVDASRVRYRQLEQEGAFDAGRGVIAGDEEAELSAAVQGRSLAFGLYATDTWRLAAATHATATLRFNRASVRNQLDTVDDDSGLLEVKPTEQFSYRSWNPALGLVQQLGGGLTLFGNWARNARVPTVIELGCADPAEPCRLPAGLQSDPYLKQVRSTSLEAGLRWRPAPQQRLELSLYRNNNHDDILFGSVSATGQLGYFQNFSRTRHQGLDASWEARLGAWQLSAGYSHLQATYQAHGTLRMGERNVQIQPGTRIAGLPRHSARLALDWRLAPGWSLGAEAQLLSSRTVQGNEDGLLEDDADEVHRLRIAGYGLLHLRASWQPRPGLELSLRLANAGNRRHASHGALAETVFDARGAYTGSEREALFVAPGTPRTLWAGLSAQF